MDRHRQISSLIDGSGKEIMSQHELNTIMGLAAAQINDPQYRPLLLLYAGEIAPPCIAEALMKTLKLYKRCADVLGGSNARP